MSGNARILADAYAAFAEGDVPAVLAVMSPDIVWNEAENLPQADRNPYVGPDAASLTVRSEILVDLGLKGYNCIVLGGSRGIGRSIALGLAEEGANVARTRSHPAGSNSLEACLSMVASIGACGDTAFVPIIALFALTEGR